ncbi:SGNH/GDSL hydrolase family protein [Rhodoflexus sp.]
MAGLYLQSSLLLGRVLANLPYLLQKGRAIRANVARLPLPQDQPFGIVGEGQLPFRLLVFGESTVAGVGIPHHADALGGACARALAAQHPDLQVKWLAVGKNGLTVAKAIRYFEEQVPAQQTFDMLLIGLGANDVFKFTPVWKWQKDIQKLLQIAAARSPQIVWATVPPVGQFPIFHTPENRKLQQLIARQRQLLELALVNVQQNSAIPFTYVQLDFSFMTDDMFVADGVHPSAKANALWTAEMIKAIGKPLIRR